jgi:hypothetical protein
MDTQHLKMVLNISRAFSGMLFLLFLMMLTDITECGMKNDYYAKTLALMDYILFPQ